MRWEICACFLCGSDEAESMTGTGQALDSEGNTAKQSTKNEGGKGKEEQEQEQE